MSIVATLCLCYFLLLLAPVHSYLIITYDGWGPITYKMYGINSHPYYNDLLAGNTVSGVLVFVFQGNCTEVSSLPSDNYDYIFLTPYDDCILQKVALAKAKEYTAVLTYNYDTLKVVDDSLNAENNNNTLPLAIMESHLVGELIAFGHYPGLIITIEADTRSLKHHSNAIIMSTVSGSVFIVIIIANIFVFVSVVCCIYRRRRKVKRNTNSRLSSVPLIQNEILQTDGQLPAVETASRVAMETPLAQCSTNNISFLKKKRCSKKVWRNIRHMHYLLYTKRMT